MSPGGLMGLRYYLWLFVKKYKITNSWTTKKATEKSKDLESLEFKIFNDVDLAKFDCNQILFNKISHRHLVTVRLLLGETSSINLKRAPSTTYDDSMFVERYVSSSRM